jgi:preprotein translocase subunit YajC
MITGEVFNLFLFFTLQLFLYFPEDKSEYIPAAFTMLLFGIAAVVTMRLIIKVSKKEAQAAKQLEEKLKDSDRT